MTWLGGRIAQVAAASAATPPGASDEDAMARVRDSGDPAAFAGLVARWERPVRRLCARMSGDEHRGEDLAQDTFARIYQHRDRYEPGRRFSTWLWRVALNVCHAEWRRKHELSDASPAPATAAAAPDRHGPLERALGAERTAAVSRALARLPDGLRTVVVLREYQGLKFREIAEVLEIPEGTAKWRMAEALDQLARDLKPMADDVEPRAGRVPRHTTERTSEAQ
jgi:RNA polymerase sigma-70 factor (ECF subfamily)